MTYFNHKNRELFYGRHLIGTVVFAAGLFNMLSSLFLESKNSIGTTIMIGAVASLIGLFFMTAFDGTLIDLSGKRVKEYSAFFGYKNGEWKSLPVINAVELLNKEEYLMNEPNGLSLTLNTKMKVYILCAYTTADSEPALTLRFNKQKKAKETLMLFQSELVL